MVEHMHRGWAEANAEMQRLYLLTKRNYKSISKMAQIYANALKAKEEALAAEQMENEEATFEAAERNQGGNQRAKSGKRQKVKKLVCKRWTAAERAHFKGSKRLLRGLKTVRFEKPESPVDVHALATQWVRFVRVYMNGVAEEDIDEEELERADLSEAEGVKLKFVEPIHATEFKRIFKEIQECVTALEEVMDERNEEYMTHVRELVKGEYGFTANPLGSSLLTPTLIVDVVERVVPAILDMETSMESRTLRSEKIEVINEAFGVLEVKRRQIAHTPELAEKLPSIDGCIGV